MGARSSPLFENGRTEIYILKGRYKSVDNDDDDDVVQEERETVHTDADGLF